MDGPWFPQIYVLDPTEEGPEFNVWFGPAVSASISPSSGVGDDEILSYTLTITNEGYESAAYEIEASTTLGWDVTLSQSEATVTSGGSTEVTFTVKVPNVAPGEVEGPEKVTVKVTDKGYPWISTSPCCTVIGSGEEEEEGLPWTVIVGAICVVAIIAIVAYLVIIKKRG